MSVLILALGGLVGVTTNRVQLGVQIQSVR
jgi:hypothetical protein